MKIQRFVAVFLVLLFIPAAPGFRFLSAKADSDWSNGGLSWDLSHGTLTITANDPRDGNNWMHDFDSPDDPYGNSRPPWDNQRGQITRIVIGKGVRNIGEFAFREYKNLTAVEMDADSVKQIGPEAFYGCKKLKTVQFSANLITIWDFAFAYCAGLSSVTFPASLQTIEDAAFAHCSLTSVSVPEGAATKTLDFFYPLTSEEPHLYHIAFPAGIRNVYNGAFAYNPLPYDNPEFILPDNVTSVGAEAFDGCGSVQYIYVPMSCETFGSGCFPEGAAVVVIYANDALRSYTGAYGIRLIELEDPDAGNG